VDATGGGHRYGVGVPGKTEFPANWDEDKIIDSILPGSPGVRQNPRNQ
jgi:hypothetical protein